MLGTMGMGADFPILSDRGGCTNELGEPMNLKEIKELIEMIRGTDVSEIEFEREGSRIRIRIGENHLPGYVEQFSMPKGVEKGRETMEVPMKETRASEPVIPDMAPNQYVVTSPMVGTFYRSPAPGSPPFVEIGNAVEKGQTICIIEAMKLMNEIEAERQGRLVKTLKEDKEPVEYGDPLFILEPLS